MRELHCYELGTDANALHFGQIANAVLDCTAEGTRLWSFFSGSASVEPFAEVNTHDSVLTVGEAPYVTSKRGTMAFSPRRSVER